MMFPISFSRRPEFLRRRILKMVMATGCACGLVLLSASFAQAQVLIGFDDASPVAVAAPSVVRVVGDTSSAGVAGVEVYALEDVRSTVQDERADTGVEIFSLDGGRNAGIKQTKSDNYAAYNKKIVPVLMAGAAMDAPVTQKGAPVDLQADVLEHDSDTGVVSARGSVVLAQNGRMLTADSVDYNTKNDIVDASGRVVLRDANGDRHYADSVVLSNGQSEGRTENLRSFLSDGTIFRAEEGERHGGKTVIMRDATYTPCRVCGDTDEQALERTPAWAIRAGKVTHDPDEKTMTYNNAWFEVYGVPVLYTPYFEHPDGSVKRKSGFLAPNAGYKSDLGFMVDTSYYRDIAPDKDATLGLRVMGRHAPLAYGEWRQRWDSAALNINGGVTYAQRPDNVGGNNLVTKKEFRGHLLSDGRWDINDKWRSGFDVELASDDQYMRQYDFRDKDVFASQIYAERFSGRDYAVGRVLGFQDLRILDRKVDQPAVLPEIITSFKGDPNSVPVLGGRWGVDASLLGLRRDGRGQDMDRVSLAANWMRRFVSDYGLVSSVDAKVREDLYYVHNRDVANPLTQQKDTTEVSRFYPRLHLQSGYPVARQFDTMQMTVEPTVALTLAPNIGINNKIPNEDSQDAQIDAANLFEPNRFPGLDSIEDQSRVTYGLRTGLYGMGGSSGDIFLGQSYRLDAGDNPFPRGSGLDNQASDFVGQISGQYDDRYSLNYRFQLNDKNFASERHEVGTNIKLAKGSDFAAQYLYARRIEGTNIDESREQIRAAIGHYLNEDWRARIGATQDLGADPGLRKANFGIDHYGQCVSWSLDGVRNLTDDSTGDSDVEVMLRIGLKNIGEFEASDLRPACSSD